MRVFAGRKYQKKLTPPYGYTVNYPYAALAVVVEGVRERSLLGRIDGQAIMLFDLNPSNDVFTLEGAKRGEPRRRVLVALGLVKVVGDSN